MVASRFCALLLILHFIGITICELQVAYKFHQLSTYTKLLVCTCTGEYIQIIEEPSTLLLPVNEIGTFYCKAQCNHRCSAFWEINGSDFKPGMSRMKQELTQGNSSVPYTLILTVNASEAINNTRIDCRYQVDGNRFEIDHSTTSALLLVESGST